MVEIVAEGPRWIDQLIGFYKKIVEDPNIPIENLNKANDAICRCIEELRPLTEEDPEESTMFYLHTSRGILRSNDGKVWTLWEREG